MEDQYKSRFYLVFISLMFAVFLSVWIEPIAEQFPSKLDAAEVWGAFVSLEYTLGGIMFLVLVSLWWWYGTFMGKIDPADGLFMFGYDFISLGSFAIAFRLWSQPFAFPVAVFIASLLMLFRFWMARELIRTNYKADCPARKAIGAALIVLGLFLLASVAAFAGMIYLISFGPGDVAMPGTNGETLLDTVWEGVQNGVIVLLLSGIGVTIYAAWLTEGFKWRVTRDVDYWLGKEVSGDASMMNGPRSGSSDPLPESGGQPSGSSDHLEE